MPFATNPVDGVRIHYEVVGNGAPLMMYNGAFRSTFDWHEWGYVEALSDQHQLILVDPRAHGKSQSPHELEAYTSELLTSDAIAVLDDLGIEKTHCLGYSMGGRICYGILRDAPERLRTMIIGGQHTEDLDELADLITASVANGMGSLVEQMESTGANYSDADKERMLEMDPIAVAVFSEAIKSERKLGLGLADTKIPCLLYVGSDDPWLPIIERTAATIPNCEFKVLAGLDHREVAGNVDLVVPMASDFLSRHTD